MFSWQAELVSSMTTDQAALLDAVDGMVWPHWSTATALALSMAKTELTNSGRPEVPKESTIVFLLTDGNADSMWETKSAADALKEVATLYVVVIGNNVNMQAVKTWPSYPWEVHAQTLLLCSLSVVDASRAFEGGKTLGGLSAISLILEYLNRFVRCLRTTI